MAELERDTQNSEAEYEEALADAKAGVPGADQLASALKRKLRKDADALEVAQRTEAGERRKAAKRARAEKDARERAEDAELRAACDRELAAARVIAEAVHAYTAAYPEFEIASMAAYALAKKNPRVRPNYSSEGIDTLLCKELTRTCTLRPSRTVPAGYCPPGAQGQMFGVVDPSKFVPLATYVEQTTAAILADLDKAETKRNQEKNP